MISSPYAVTAYVPDPRIGTWKALDAAREKLRARGIALFLDFVGNHTALDHPWMREHPEFYVQAPPEEFQKNPSLYYRNPRRKARSFIALAKDPYLPTLAGRSPTQSFQSRLRAAQLADLRTIAAHCDGIRCDMAMLQLNDIFDTNLASPPR